jgi:isopenicillin N synthase-like dioxygenase
VGEIRDACSGWGFFQITNHGISDETMERYYNQKQQFFALPKDEKEKVRRTEENSKGWYDDELTKNRVDWKEGLDIGTQAGSLDDKGLDGWNQWPQEPQEFEGVIRDYFWEMEALARKLTCCMSLGLGMEAEHFAKEFDGVHSSYLRMNYYPLCPDPSSHMAISHHTDAGAVTVLTQSMVQSLQVFQPENEQWYDVEPVDGAFVINTGDIMQVPTTPLTTPHSTPVFSQHPTPPGSPTLPVSPSSQLPHLNIPSPHTGVVE